MIQRDLFSDPAPVVRGNLTPREQERIGLATGPAPDLPRLNKQCAAILERLKRGPATNAELARLALKYSGRVSDLRAAGYKITATPIDRKEGLFRYDLIQ